MAIKHVTKRIDDWDGVSEAHKTVRFSYEGKHYEMDLSVDNHNMVHGEFGKFIAKARPVSNRGKAGRPRTSARVTKPSNKEHLAAVRTWARANGHTVNDRGRIPAEIEAAYKKAH